MSVTWAARAQIKTLFCCFPENSFFLFFFPRSKIFLHGKSFLSQKLLLSETNRNEQSVMLTKQPRRCFRAAATATKLLAHKNLAFKMRLCNLSHFRFEFAFVWRRKNSDSASKEAAIIKKNGNFNKIRFFPTLACSNRSNRYLMLLNVVLHHKLHQPCSFGFRPTLSRAS